MTIFERKPLFVAQTPWPQVPDVTLYEDTWNDHIVTQHIQLTDRAFEVQAVVSNPTIIIPGTSNPDYVCYVNETVTSSGGTPLAVIVDPQAKVICTAYYNRSLRVIPQGSALWLR